MAESEADDPRTSVPFSQVPSKWFSWVEVDAHWRDEALTVQATPFLGVAPGRELHTAGPHRRGFESPRRAPPTLPLGLHEEPIKTNKLSPPGPAL